MVTAERIIFRFEGSNTTKELNSVDINSLHNTIKTEIFHSTPPALALYSFEYANKLPDYEDTLCGETLKHLKCLYFHTPTSSFYSKEKCQFSTSVSPMLLFDNCKYNIPTLYSILFPELILIYIMNFYIILFIL